MWPRFPECGDLPCHAAPAGNRLSTLREGVLCIFVVQHIRPDQFDLSAADMRLQLEFRVGFQPHSRLALVVERTIEATEVEVQTDHLPVLRKYT